MKFRLLTAVAFTITMSSLALSPAFSQELPVSIYDRSNEVVLGQTYADGLAAFEAEDFKLATDIWKPLAEAGNTDAQVMLGVRYFEGRGVEKSDALALYWVRKSAEAGNMDAMQTINILWSMEPSLKITSEENEKWTLERAKRGDMISQSRVARKFLQKEDIENAKIWFKKAADQGDKDSQEQLAQMHFDEQFNPLIDATVSKSGTFLGPEKFPVFADTEMSEIADVAASCMVSALRTYDADDVPLEIELMAQFYTFSEYNGGYASEQVEAYMLPHAMTSQFSPELGPSVKYCQDNGLKFIEARAAEK